MENILATEQYWNTKLHSCSYYQNIVAGKRQFSISPIVGFFQSFMFVAKSVKLDPDNDGDILNAVLTVQVLPTRVSNKMVSRDQRVFKTCHDSRTGGKHFHFVHMLLNLHEGRNESTQ